MRTPDEMRDEIDRLKEYIATIVNHYHHVLTFDLVQEGIQLVNGDG